MGRFEVFGVTLVVLFTLLAMAPAPAEARSDAYYDIINDMLQGINYYDILELSRDAIDKDIRKAKRNLSLKFHPDKNPSEEATAMYILIQRAADLLQNKETREEIDILLDHGIPSIERYYGRHMHRMGVPQHDPRWVAFWFVFLSTSVHYWHRWTVHWSIHRRVRESNRFKTLRNQMAESQGLSAKDVKKKLKQGQLTEEEAEQLEPEINIKGAEKPTWTDLLPVLILRGIFNLIASAFKPSQTPEERHRAQLEEHLGRKLTDEEYAVEVQKIKAYWERKMQSGKMKKYIRWMKKNG